MAKLENLNNNGGCCGISELIGIQYTESPKQCVLDAATRFVNQKCGAILFTVQKGNPTGDALRDFIVENNLGRVTKQKPFVNHRYGPDRQIVLYVWFVNLPEFTKFWESNKPVPAAQ